jgi:type IV pilus assembly protein PilC
MATTNTKGRAGTPAAKSKSKGGSGGFVEFLKRLNAAAVSIQDVAIFSRQFSTMINAGLPVLQCLSIIAEQQVNATFKKVINGLKDDIGSGGNLSDAMAKHPKVFNELYVNMVRSGELGGVLDVILERLSVYMEKAEALRRKIKSAMMYPTIVLSVAVLVVCFLMVKVIPTFQETFSSFGHELPPLTQGLINVSNFMQHYWYFMGAGAFLVYVGFNLFVKTPKGRYIVDGILLNLPVVGPLQRKSAVAKFARTLGTLLKSGVPILEALETVAKTSGNKRIEEVIDGARVSIREGQGMTEPLKKGGVFPPMLIQMVSVGEETGKIDDMLGRAAVFYEEEVDVAVEGLSSAMEPLIIVFLGVTIGTIVVAMFMPMFDLGNVVSE